jgi:MOSC domain-containing protein YiiM
MLWIAVYKRSCDQREYTLSRAQMPGSAAVRGWKICDRQRLKRRSNMKLGTVLSIQIAPAGNDPLQNLEQVRAVEGQGLEGDRYYNRTGTYSNKHDESREATFIESEALAALADDYHIALTGAESRRNFTTRGVALNHLVGRQFKVGEAVFRGIRLCEPCTHLEEASGKPARKGLIHRGGLRAQIVKSGLVCVGDVVQEA